MGEFLGLLSVILLAFAAGAVHVMVHEAAHALAARAISVGDGKAWLRFRLFGTVVKVGGFNGGATHLEPRSVTGLRTKLAGVIVAGSAEQPGPGTGGVAAAGWRRSRQSRRACPVAVVVLGVLLAVFNLLPLRLQGGAVRTDGAVLLSLARGGTRSARQALAAGRLSAAMRRHAAGELPSDDDRGPVDDEPVDRSDPVVLGVEGARRILTGEFGEAVLLLREAAQLPQDDHTRALTLNNLAWTLLLSRPEGWLPEADEASAEAVRLQPQIAAFDSTRGCVLVELGEVVEGRDLMRRSDLDEAAPNDRALVLDHLLRAEAQSGNLYGARAALFRLIAEGAPDELVTGIRALLRAIEVEHALSSMLGPDGRFVWPEHRPGDEFSLHVAEMRSVLTAFAHEAVGDPRGDAVRAALGGASACPDARTP